MPSRPIVAVSTNHHPHRWRRSRRPRWSESRRILTSSFAASSCVERGRRTGSRAGRRRLYSASESPRRSWFARGSTSGLRAAVSVFIPSPGVMCPIEYRRHTGTLQCSDCSEAFKWPAQVRRRCAAVDPRDRPGSGAKRLPERMGPAWRKKRMPAITRRLNFLATGGPQTRRGNSSVRSLRRCTGLEGRLSCRGGCRGDGGRDQNGAGSRRASEGRRRPREGRCLPGR